jgi:hypothetical protein
VLQGRSFDSRLCFGIDGASPIPLAPDHANCDRIRSLIKQRTA